MLTPTPHTPNQHHAFDLPRNRHMRRPPRAETEAAGCAAVPAGRRQSMHVPPMLLQRTRERQARLQGRW